MGSAALLYASRARASATLLRSPYLQNVQRDRASILWTTIESGSGAVVVAGPEGTYTVPAKATFFAPSVTKLAYSFYQYQADLTGLHPGTKYAYRITLNGETITPGPVSFRTAPSSGNCSFVVFGDSGENTPEQKTLIGMMAAEPNISFAVHTGDLAYPQATFALLDANYFGLNAPLMDHLPFFPTPGNHEYMVDAGAPYVASVVVPDSNINPADHGHYYSFDWGDIHFASLDTNLMATASVDRMLAWLENDLQATRQYWRIVFFHHPPYPTGHHLNDPYCAAVRARVNPIVERYGVQLVLAGHEHGYERTMPLAADQIVPAGTGTTYVITGGGGAELHDSSTTALTTIALEDYNYLRIDVTGGSLTVRATDAQGKEIDRFTLRPKPVIANQGVVSVGDYSTSFAPGELVSIFGQNLAVRSTACSTLNIPSDLGGVRVQLGDTAVPLLYVSPSQINVQIPFESSGAGTLSVTNDNGMAQRDVTVVPTAPSIIAVTVNDAVATADNAPAAGSAVVVYATGLGACKQTVATGSAPNTAAPAVAHVDVFLNTTKIAPLYAGLTAEFAGLYQVNFVVPSGVTAGTYSLRITTPDRSSRSQQLIVN